ncbi:hypothetical protein RSOL_382860 [Rhizoctonia solani AG-3 Rhs1AP]|uniref:Uncharacterized protein n=2 Tax=Rhizoctonia solani AG-3 TaxID=1086053 RepID=A0A074RSD9_9AGAM|nr:hypothetical protein RSOL_382860 [Rhizoctonia solani AG-3 Rhs1AP]KEP50041.1 hypothetical protein V565_087780 [Rhizoctonia solani 123E]
MAEPGSTSFSEDWDRATPAPSTPPSNSKILPEGTPNGSRSLSDLMKLHAEHGKENLQLNQQEEQRLEEELARWVSWALVLLNLAHTLQVNSEEDDDTYFGRRSLDGASARPRAAVDYGRPRGQSESGANGQEPRERKDSSKMLIPGRGVIAGK